jgi:HEAT repeat protein
MEQIFGNLRSLATASYPLLQQLASSPSPGERLAAISILEVFASEPLLPFLTGLLKQEKPFVCYHALKALRFAVNALDASSYPALTNAITEARSALKDAGVPMGSDRERELAAAERELQANVKSMSVTTRTYE